MTTLFKVLLLTLILSGCASIYHKSPAAMQEQRVCQAHCIVQMQHCKKVCVDNCANCLNKTYFKSVKHYSRFVHEKIVQGGTVTRDLNSYRDPLQCRKITCSCLADFNACSQLCGGIIRKQLSPVFTCGEQF